MPQAPIRKRDNACSTAGASAGSHLYGAPVAHRGNQLNPGSQLAWVRSRSVAKA